MPRIARHQYLEPNGYYHVISRSINQTVIFRSPEDFKHFRSLEQQAKQRFPIRLFHYILMGTHFHFVLSVINPADLPGHLGYIKWHYARWMRNKYGWKGPLWRERYRSLPIENEEYLSACGAYVEFNPVRAGLCRDAAEYPFSSYHKYHLGTPDDLLDDYSPTPVPEFLLTAIHEPGLADALFIRSPGIGNPVFVQECARQHACPK